MLCDVHAHWRQDLGKALSAGLEVEMMKGKCVLCGEVKIIAEMTGDDIDGNPVGLLACSPCAQDYYSWVAAELRAERRLVSTDRELDNELGWEQTTGL